MKVETKYALAIPYDTNEGDPVARPSDIEGQAFDSLDAAKEDLDDIFEMENCNSVVIYQCTPVFLAVKGPGWKTGKLS